MNNNYDIAFDHVYNSIDCQQHEGEIEMVLYLS